MKKRYKKQQGFTLLMVIFLLVIMGGALGLLSNLVSNQSKGTTSVIMRSQAHYAAFAALEWAAHEAVNGQWCTSSTSSTLEFPSHEGTINSFSVALTCTKTSHTEESSFNFFDIKAIASSGNYGEITYARKELRMLISDGAAL